MDQEYEPLEDQAWDIYEEMHRLIEINPWAWQSIGAVAGLAGGALSPFFGTLLVVVAWFINSESTFSTLNVLSIVCFVLTIPLLAFGAHCLDLLERKTARLGQMAEERPAELGPAAAPVREANRNRRLKLTGASVAVAFLFVLPASGRTQQTIFSVPSTDVLDKGT